MPPGEGHGGASAGRQAGSGLVDAVCSSITMLSSGVKERNGEWEGHVPFPAACRLPTKLEQQTVLT